MKGKALVEATFNLEKTERAPWVPFVGCHGGFLIGVTATDYLQSETKMVEGIEKAIELYSPDGIPIAFDLQVEAEILGCKLLWSDENPPAVTSHPLNEGVKLEELKIPQKTEGRLPIILNTTRTIRERYTDIALYGLITGPFTLALHLLGSDIFMQMFRNEGFVKELIEFCKKVCVQVADYHIEAGCDVIALVDPMTSQIGPDHFRQFVTKPATEIFGHIHTRDCLSSFFVCGHAQQNIEAMCECKPRNISIDENIPLDYVKNICLQRNISFGGNLKLTVVLLLGDQADSVRHAKECLETGGEKGFLLAPGCDLPYATPLENLTAISGYLLDPYQKDVLETLESHDKVQEILDMTDYGRTDRIIVDIITLDSEACAPCQYMVEAVKEVTPSFEGIVEWREHKIKYRESLTFMTSLMVKNIPTICIDGKIAFVSRIPPKLELISAIQKRILEKLNYKIRSNQGALLVFGKDNTEIDKIKSIVEQVAKELGSDFDIQYSTDEKEAFSYGVTTTPSIVSAKYRIKSEGKIPSSTAVKEWLKEIA